MKTLKIGIIGGSGLDDPNLLQDYNEINFETPFGKPSSPITTGKINGIEVFIISRHGRKHEIPPTQINNRANIFALKQQKCKYIIATTAVGSLREDIQRGDFVILDQFIDFTKNRQLSFFEKFEFGPIHAQMAYPFSEELRQKLGRACDELGFANHKTGTVITIEGPRFSTTAESKLFKTWGADVINMSIAPEAILAREAELEYAAVAMVTDYDSWKTNEEPVSWQAIGQVMSQNSENVKKVILQTINSFSYDETCKMIKENIRTIPNWPKQGVMFRDITTLLQNKEAMNKTIDILVNRYKEKEIDVIAGIESRGFIFGAILAERLGTSFVPIRKPGKLPAETISQEYSLEYGIDKVEIHKDAIKPNQKVLIVDDLLATSGTMMASCQLIEKLGGKIEECTVIIELEALGGKKKLEDKGYRLFSIVKFKETE
jgi:5'-methylthioadenosine phosphorylase